MKTITALLILFCVAAIAAAQPKQSLAVLPSIGDLDPQGLELLTDKVREIASKTLPMKDFHLLKLDAIIKRIGEEELYRSCKEGVCIGELARKTSANYGARCDIIKRGNNLALKFELYSVDDDAIMETFTKYPIPIKNDLSVMLAELETRLPAAFKKMVSVRNAETAKSTLPVVQVQQTANTFTDSRDGKTYKKVTIGGQTWMAENLNYDVSGSKCYGENGKVVIAWDDEYNPTKTKTLSTGEVQSNCVKYGRLYMWNTAIKACPAGWHLPSDKEWTTLWTTLVNYADGEETAGKKLKSTSGWNDYKGKSGNGTDSYGFSALPGGFGGSDGYFHYAGDDGSWWSATEVDASGAWYRSMGYGYEYVGRSNLSKNGLFSVRCVQDYSGMW